MASRNGLEDNESLLGLVTFTPTVHPILRDAYNLQILVSYLRGRLSLNEGRTCGPLQFHAPDPRHALPDHCRFA